MVAWRGDQRYAERLSRATLDEPTCEAVRSGASYIITGGLGGLGLVVARWLADSGAGRIVLNGRSEPSDEQRAVLAELERKTEIVVVSGDVASEGVADTLVAAAGESHLRGILHAAAVLDDSLVFSMTKDSVERVWAPKVVGALRLHQASIGCELDWWLGFSSTASLLGGPGQASYACASAWLDALVDWRRASGLPAAVINWGPWAEVGLARTLTGGALDPITPAEGVAALEPLLGSDRCHTGVARLRPDRALITFPEIRNLGYFTSVVEELEATGDGGDWAGPDALTGLDADEAQRLMTDRLRARIAAVMGYADRSAVDTTMPLTELGMDSLMAVRIRNTTRADFGVEPPVALLLQGASLQDLTADLVHQLGLSGDSQALEQQQDAVRDRAQQRAAARQQAAMRRKARTTGMSTGCGSIAGQRHCGDRHGRADSRVPTMFRRSGTTFGAAKSRSSRSQRESSGLPEWATRCWRIQDMSGARRSSTGSMSSTLTSLDSHRSWPGRWIHNTDCSCSAHGMR